MVELRWIWVQGVIEEKWRASEGNFAGCRQKIVEVESRIRESRTIAIDKVNTNNRKDNR